MAGMVTSTAAAFGLRIVVHPLVIVVGLVAAHAFVVNKLENGDWRVVSLHAAAVHPRWWAPAAAITALAIGIPALLLVAAGQLEIIVGAGGSPMGTAFRVAALVIPFAFGEELLIRGYLFTVLRRLWGWQGAIAITSLSFGLIHLANPGASVLSILNVVLAGVFLGMVLVRTGSLYAAWAAHAAWNFTLAGILHADVSGVTLGEMAKYQMVDRGPAWLTGGVWGPEGGIAASLGLLAAIVVVARFIGTSKDGQQPVVGNLGERAYDG